MARTNKRDLMMITLDKATELYLATLETEGKSPRYVDWLKTRLRYFKFISRECMERDLNFKKSVLTMAETISGI